MYAKRTVLKMGGRVNLSQLMSAIYAYDGTWRQALPAVAASKQAYNFSFASSNSTAERAQMVDVLADQHPAIRKTTVDGAGTVLYATFGKPWR